MIPLTIAVVTAVALLTIFARRRYKPTDEEIAQLIENRLKFGMSREWDYFRLVTIPDLRLDSIRERCLELDYSSAEDRERTLKDILGVLRAGTQM